VTRCTCEVKGIPGFGPHLSGCPVGKPQETPMKTRTYFDVRFDVTDLDQSERDALVGEVVAQSDRSEGHPSVEVETEWNEVEVEDEREVLVHLNVTLPSSYDVTDETVAKAILDAYGVGVEGAPLALYGDMKVVVALAETVS